MISIIPTRPVGLCLSHHYEVNRRHCPAVAVRGITGSTPSNLPKTIPNATPLTLLPKSQLFSGHSIPRRRTSPLAPRWCKTDADNRSSPSPTRESDWLRWEETPRCLELGHVM